MRTRKFLGVMTSLIYKGLQIVVKYRHNQEVLNSQNSKPVSSAMNKLSAQLMEKNINRYERLAQNNNEL